MGQNNTIYFKRHVVRDGDVSLFTNRISGGSPPDPYKVGNFLTSLLTVSF